MTLLNLGHAVCMLKEYAWLIQHHSERLYWVCIKLWVEVHLIDGFVLLTAVPVDTDLELVGDYKVRYITDVPCGKVYPAQQHSVTTTPPKQAQRPTLRQASQKRLLQSSLSHAYCSALLLVPTAQEVKEKNHLASLQPVLVKAHGSCGHDYHKAFIMRDCHSIGQPNVVSQHKGLASGGAV